MDSWLSLLSLVVDVKVDTEITAINYKKNRIVFEGSKVYFTLSCAFKSMFWFSKTSLSVTKLTVRSRFFILHLVAAILFRSLLRRLLSSSSGVNCNKVTYEYSAFLEAININNLNDRVPAIIVYLSNFEAFIFDIIRQSFLIAITSLFKFRKLSHDRQRSHLLCLLRKLIIWSMKPMNYNAQDCLYKSWFRSDWQSSVPIFISFLEQLRVASITQYIVIHDLHTNVIYAPFEYRFFYYCFIIYIATVKIHVLRQENINSFN